MAMLCLPFVGNEFFHIIVVCDDTMIFQLSQIQGQVAN